jgi:hypothetical protein
VLDPEILIITILTVVAIGCGGYSLRLPPGEAKAKWGFLGGVVFGVLFCFVALWNLIGIHTARHLSATGLIQNLQQQGGRSSSSDFTVVPAGGQPLKVHSEFGGPNLHEGETVVVEELSFHSTLIHLRVLDGKNAGWTMNEGDGTRSSAFVLLLGAGVILGARNRRLSHPNG